MRSRNARNMNYLYAPESVHDRQYIYQDICKAIGNENRLAMFKDIVGLSERLKNFNNPEIIVFLGVTWMDIQNILDNRELFLDAALIILFLDKKQETSDMANRLHRLRPKFIGVLNDDLERIMPIVQSLVRANH